MDRNATPDSQRNEITASLAELALDLRHCWEHTADPLWSRIDAELWELTHNPWVILQTTSRTKLDQLLCDPGFRRQVEELAAQQLEHPKRSAWFQQTHSNSHLSGIAFFSFEFGLAEALPLYSGGLGNVAGDFLKAANDLGVPIVGVGLLYQQGFRQVIDADGSQRSLFPYNDPGQLPITPVRDESGEWFRLRVQLPGHLLWLRAWQVRVGRVRLYLLDANDPANLPAYRGITSELYGGGPEHRLAQEMVLGLGGWRLLRGLGIKPEVCHLNEGHAALAVLERALTFMEESGQPFAAALAATRVGNLFTTHTPVSSGFDRFAPDLVAHYLGDYAKSRLHIGLPELLALGRVNPVDPSEPFNMAYVAIRGSGAINGVSRLHGTVSRRIFQCLFPRWPEAEVPIDHVTNGVHTPTWDSAAADSLWTHSCGRERWRGTMATVARDFRRVSDRDLWDLRRKNRLELVNYVRARLGAGNTSRGESAERAQEIFAPETLTLGFARRFTTYKRPNLLLTDPARLIRILTNPDRPVQIVIAGKAHPQDYAGQALVREWVRFVRRPEVRRHAVFLSDHDLVLAARMVQGADLWLNTPLRPWEACGTSGMKVLVNGGLNLSELDGWWAEAYSPDLGWSLGDGIDHDHDPWWDAAEADALYSILENQVVPTFYRRDRSGVPTQWVARMRESMARLTPHFSANRCIREYTERYYLPAARAYLHRASSGGAAGLSVLRWQRELSRGWANVRFGDLRVETVDGKHSFAVQVHPGALPADAICVQLYADPIDGEAPCPQQMRRGLPISGALDGFEYNAEVSARRPAAEYTPRIVPSHLLGRAPLEDAHILWFR